MTRYTWQGAGDVEFEWDEAKRLSNIAKHDVDFFDMRAIFDGRPVRIEPSRRGTEQRFTTTAIINGLTYTVVWTRRPGRIRIISARRASDDERRAYHEVHG